MQLRRSSCRASRAFAVALVALTHAGSSLAIDPHASFEQLPTGNGYGFAVYNAATSRVDVLLERPYAQRSATEPTADRAFDAYFGVRASGGATWLAQLRTDRVSYENQSHVVHAQQSFGPLLLETYAFAPWNLPAAGVVLVLHARNRSAVPVPDASMYALLNFHLGTGAPEPGTDGERITWNASAGAYVETGASARSLTYLPIGIPQRHAASPAAVYAIGSVGGLFPDVGDSGTMNDAVAGFQWAPGSLPAGGDAWVGVVVTLATPADAIAWLAGRDAPATLANELAAWESWRAPPPAGLSDGELRVWRQGESVLRMAQSREPPPSRGQILAALPPGIWSIAWVRDMTYATVALARSGHRDEANAAIDFLRDSPVGAFRTYVGHDYHVSVVRYYGDGTEWSDTDANGPNVEFDGFGLALWAAHTLGRTDLDANADTLRALRDDTGLVSPDSSIWEVHWNGRQKHFAYTSIAAAHGLCLAGDSVAAAGVRDAIVRELTSGSGGLAGNREELRAGQNALDAAVIEAIDFGLIDARGGLARDTLRALDRLRTPAGRGFARNDDGGGYDAHEWVFVDLRVASALRRMGYTLEADALLAWVTAQADANFGLQAELYHPSTADYAGAIPMVGFGAGAYMLALLDRASADAPSADCFPAVRSGGDAGGDGGSNGAMRGACSVTAAGRRGSSVPEVALVVALLVAAARLHRRRVHGRLALSGLAALASACGSPSGPPRDASDASDAALFGDVPARVSALPVRDCATRFVYPLGRSASRVVAVGEWNGFDTATGVPLTDGLFSNVYRGATVLTAGSHAYKFVADGAWALDPTNAQTAYVGGTENSRLRVPDCNRPQLRVLRAEVTDARTVLLEVQYVDGASRAGLDVPSVSVALGNLPLPAVSVRVEPSSARITVQFTAPTNDKYTFRFDARDAAARAADTLRVPMWVEDEPFQWGDGVLYFAFTDRFRDGNSANDAPVVGVDPRANYQGGDLAGVLQAMRDGYFDALGVRALWLSPVNANTNSAGLGSGGHLYAGYHGYWVSEPRTVEERFGSFDDLRALTSEAHRRGIRVLLDLANNQLHMDHPYYRDHRDWFNGDGSCVCGGANCDWDTHALECWFTSYLPDVNWTTMTAVDTMIDDALFWITEADVDGFRVDAVKHMPHIASTTLRARLRDAVETGNARYYLVGETFSGAGERALVASFVGDNELWGQFDFPLFWSIVGAFANNQGTMADLDASVAASESAYGSAIMSPFLGNHDVERFLSRAAGQLTGGDQAWTNPPGDPTVDAPYDQLFLALTFVLTQPGMPLIYYGDEIGLPGAGDPDNRRMMRFGTALTAREQRLLDRVRVVAHARGTHPGLRRGARRTLLTDGDGYVYARGAGATLAVVTLNRGQTTRTVRVTVPGELASDGTVLRDLLGGPPVTISAGAIDVPFAPRGAALYVQ